MKMTMKDAFGSSHKEDREPSLRSADSPPPRSRIEENQYTNVWIRLVMKLLFVTIRLTELSIRLVMGEKQMTDVEQEEEWEAVNSEPGSPFNMWPNPGAQRSPHSILSDTSTTRTQTTEHPSPSYALSSGSETPYATAKAFPQIKSKEAVDMEQLKLKSKEAVDLEQLKIDFERRKEQCAHKRTTRKGTNAFIEIERCLTCGKTLKSERKNTDAEKIKKEPASMEKTDSEIEEEKKEYQEFMEFQKWKESKDKQKKNALNKV